MESKDLLFKCGSSCIIWVLILFLEDGRRVKPIICVAFLTKLDLRRLSCNFFFLL